MSEAKWWVVAYGILLVAVTQLSACGGGSSATEYFKTVTVSVNATNIGAADVNKLIDTNNDGIKDSNSIPPADSTTVTISTAANTAYAATPSRIQLKSVNITFIPVSSVAPGVLPPAIDPINLVMSDVISPNTSLAKTIEVVTQAIKIRNSGLIVSGDIYTYNVVLTFSAEEVETNTSGSFSTTITVNMADYADE